jgi:hypothetical protein
MTQAGIRPETARVRPGDPELIKVTGARRPSGTAVVVADLTPAAPAAAPGTAATRRRRPRRPAAAPGAGFGVGQTRGKSASSAGRGGAAGRRARRDS